MSSGNACRFKGKVVLVTGASKGIGAGVAQAFAREGASVVVNYSTSASNAKDVVAEITKAGGTAVAIQANVSKHDDIIRLIAETKKTYGKIDVLVNNAGVYSFGPLDGVTAEEFHRQFDTNVLGLLLTTQEAVRHMNDGGAIVNISSVAVSMKLPGSSIYAGTKAAVNAITGVLSKELAGRKIRVNAVNPGMTETHGVKDMLAVDDTFKTLIVGNTPLARMAQVEDIAPTVLFLASDESAYTTGEHLNVSGGLS